MDKTQPHPVFKLATELGPLIVFFVANAKFNLFVATGAFMVAIVAAMIASYVVVRHVPMMAIVTAVIVLVFGTLTLVLHDETFIKVKPTIIYGLFAAILGVNRLFVADAEEGGFDGFLLAPVDRSAMLLAKGLTLLIFLLVPEAATQRRLEILSEIAEMLSDRELRERLKTEPDAAKVHELISNWEPLKSVA